MCGIIGYIGPKDAVPILINGLKRLEYRGYDSTGVATINKLDNSIKQVDFFRNIEVYDLFEISGNLLIHDSRGIYKVENLMDKKFIQIYSGSEISLKKINSND